jgi:putative NADH-flavin reductase
MTIIIFGSTGAIGKSVVKQALDRGYTVKAYLRNPSGLTIIHPALQVIVGELSDYPQIRQAIAGVDAVISTLGPPLVYKYKGQPLAEGHRNIIQAMRESGVHRLITLATPSVKFEKDKSSLTTKMPPLMARLLYPSAYKEIVEIGRMVATSGLDWTIVRIIAPDNKPAAGGVKVTFGDKKIGLSVSRADIATFMLQQVEDKSYILSMPIIGS